MFSDAKQYLHVSTQCSIAVHVTQEIIIEFFLVQYHLLPAVFKERVCPGHLLGTDTLLSRLPQAPTVACAKGSNSSARGEEPKIPRTFAFLCGSEEAVGAVSIQHRNTGAKKPGPEVYSERTLFLYILQSPVHFL